jgi:hypothetical protein
VESAGRPEVQPEISETNNPRPDSTQNSFELLLEISDDENLESVDEEQTHDLD